MTRHGLLWFFLIVMIFLFGPLVIYQREYQSCVETELASAQRWYNVEAVDAILSRTNAFYDMTMVRTGIDPLVRRHFVQPVPNKQDLAPGVDVPQDMTPYADHMLEYWGNFLYNIWIFEFRVAHSWSWLLYLTPFLFATIFDGVMTRKAKLASFQYTSPTIYNVSWHMIIFLVAASMVAFAFVTPVSPFFYPIIITAIGFLIRLLISNIQHSA